MNRHLFFITFMTLTLALSTSCDNSTSGNEEPESPILGEGQWSGEAIFTIEGNDTLDVNERTYTIPSDADEFSIEVYSIGIKVAQEWKIQNGMDVALVDSVKIDRDGKSDTPPVEWSMPSCMAGSDIKERLRAYNFYKQRIRITIDKSVAPPRELRVYLEAPSYKEFFTSSSCVNFRQE